MTDMIDRLSAMLQSRHEDLLNYISISGMAQMQQRQQHNLSRMNSQVDSQLKQCNPDYEPPEEDDMGDVNIYAGIHASDATLQALADSGSSGGNPANGEVGPALPRPEKPSFFSGIIKSMLPLLATAGIAIAAARYFAPDDTDTTNNFDIEALPYEP